MRESKKEFYTCHGSVTPTEIYESMSKPCAACRQSWATIRALPTPALNGGVHNNVCLQLSMVISEGVLRLILWFCEGCARR